MCKVTQTDIKDLKALASIGHDAMERGPRGPLALAELDHAKLRLVRVHALIRRLEKEAV